MVKILPVLFLLLISASAFADPAAELAASLDDNALVAQLLLTGIDGKRELTPAMRALLEKFPAGGIMLFGYNLDSSKGEVKALLSETGRIAAAKTGIPPFMAVDHEGGLVHRFGSVAARLPSAFSFWEIAQREGRDAAIERAENLYSRSAKEIKDLGITMVLGPVAETLNNDNRLFLETRSYGPDADFTLAAASAYIKSMDSAGIASVVKHFPGNTAADPHSKASVLKDNKAALDEIARPFAGLIAAVEPSAIMVSHVMVPALDSRRNASLSRPIIEDWLRGELGFNGIVIADDFSMGAVAATGLSHEEAAVEALSAGVDMIMVWPLNISSVHAAILKAFHEGRLSRERLLEAAARIIKEKFRYGIITLSE